MRFSAIFAFAATLGCVLGAATVPDNSHAGTSLVERQNVGDRIERLADIFEGAGSKFKPLFWQFVRELREKKQPQFDRMLELVDSFTDNLSAAADDVESIARYLKLEFYTYLSNNHGAELVEWERRADKLNDWFNSRADDVEGWGRRIIYLQVCHKDGKLDTLCVLNSAFSGVRFLVGDFATHLDDFVGLTKDDSFSVPVQQVLEKPKSG